MIPIYRAKKIDSDEYVVGQYLAYKGYATIFNEYGLEGVTVDDTTLSIHFPDMLDSNQKPIFASLQEDGKGGDIVEYKGRQYTFGYKKEYFKVGLLNFRGWQLTTSDLLKVKTIGIQE